MVMPERHYFLASQYTTYGHTTAAAGRTGDGRVEASFGRFIFMPRLSRTFLSHDNRA